MVRISFVLMFLAVGICGCSLLVDEPQSSYGFGISTDYVRGILVITTDYSDAGGVCVINPQTFEAEVLADTIHSDSVASANENLVFVVQRLGADSVEVRSRINNLKLVANYSVGAGSNPQALVPIDDTRALVVKYASAYLDVINYTTGEVLKQIDGSCFAHNDPDGIPEFGMPAVAENLAYIPVQHLNRYNSFLPYRNGELAVFDIEKLQFVDFDKSSGGIQGLQLEFADPYFVRYFANANAIAVMSVGEFGKFDGGIELLEPFTNKYLGVLLTEQQVGGELISAVLLTRTSGYAVVSDANFNTSLIKFSQQNIQIIAKSNSFAFVDLLLDAERNLLFLADRSLKAPGVRVFDAATGDELTEQPIDCLLPPFFLLNLH